MKHYDLKKLEVLAAAGMNQSEIANELGVGTSTLHLHLSKNPDVLDAYNRGKERWRQKKLEKIYKTVVSDDEKTRNHIKALPQNDMKVYVAIERANCRKRAEIADYTELSYECINRCLDSLCSQGKVVRVDNGQFEEFYTPAQNDARLNSKVVRVDPSQFGKVVSDNRLSEVLAVAKREEKNITPKRKYVRKEQSSQVVRGKLVVEAKDETNTLTLPPAVSEETSGVPDVVPEQPKDTDTLKLFFDQAKIKLEDKYKQDVDALDRAYEILSEV